MNPTDYRIHMQLFPPLPTHASVPATDCMGTPVHVGSIVAVAREADYTIKQVPGVVTQILPTRIRVHTNTWKRPEWPENERHDLFKESIVSMDANLSPDQQKPFHDATVKFLDFTDPTNAKGINLRYSGVVARDPNGNHHIAIIEGYGTTIADRDMSLEHFSKVTGMSVLGYELDSDGSWTSHNRIVDCYLSRKKINEFELGEYINMVMSVAEYNALVNPAHACKVVK